MDDVASINKKLIEIYGRDTDERPNYKIVWSSSQRERRRGEFVVHTDSGIYLRTEKCVKDVEKYPLFLDMWVLEQLVDASGNPELVEKYSYEPLWIFGNGNSERQPIWKAVKFLITAKLYLQPKRLTLTDLEDLEEERMERERALFKQMLQNESPYIPSALHDGAAVTVLTDNKRPLGD